MGDNSEVSKQIVENSIRSFMDNPILGVAAIVFIIVLLLVAIILLGFMFKKKDESVGSGIRTFLQRLFLVFIAIYLLLIVFNNGLPVLLLLVIGVIICLAIDFIRKNKQ